MTKQHTSVARLFQRLQPVVTLIYHRYWLFILAALVITGAALYLLIGGFLVKGGPKLKVNTNLASLLPQNYQSVQSLNRIKEKVSGIDKLEILIQSEDFDSSLKFANHLMPKLRALRNPENNEPYIGNIEYRNEVEFFQKNQLLFLDLETLDDLQASIENRIEEEKNKLNPLFVDDLFGDEDEGTNGENLSLKQLEEKYDAHVPKEYLATDDGRILMLRCYPYGTALNLARAQIFYNTVENLIESENPKSFHPTMFFELGGEVRNKVEEYNVVTTDAMQNLVGGIIFQILLIILYFRQPIPLKKYPSLLGKIVGLVTGIFRQLVAALLIALPLIMSIIWTFGITTQVIGSLNTITVFLFVILFGMGIDFGIHIYSRYLETRLDGKDILTSLQTTILKTGAGIFTAAVTTAAAFYTLQVADFKGFSDFGFIAGTGILFSMISMLFILPAFITLGEKLGVISAVQVTLTDSEAGKTPLKFYRPVLIGTAVLIVITAFFLPKLSFEYNFRELRSNLPALSAVKAKIHDLKMDAEGSDLGSPAVILADNHEDLIELVDVLNDIKKNDTDFPTFAKVESIFDKFPRHQDEKLKKIAKIRQIVDEEGLDLVKGEDRNRLQKLRNALEVNKPFTLDEIPLSVKRKFIGKDGKVGEFAFVYPSVLLRDGLNSIEFSRDLKSLSGMEGIKIASGKTYFAASGSIIAADMLILMQEDSRIAILLTVIVIIFFLYLDLRSIKNTFIVLLPLLGGFFIIFAIQLIFGIKYNLFNMIVLPIIIGYGVDDGVHLIHRYLEEGAGSLRRVLRTTGWVVVMTTLTTCAGFAGLIFVRHGGLKSMGSLAVIGLLVVMVASLCILPSALQWQELRKKNK